MLETPDISREGFTGEKGAHFLRTLFNRRATEVLVAHKKFLDINFSGLWNLGKRGIILDIDECIAPHHGDILPENIDKIKELLEIGWRIVVFSNMKKTSRYDELESLGIKVVTSIYAKPDIKGFQECVEKLELSASKTVMIGDNYLTDGGCINAGIDFIKIKPINTQGDYLKPSRIVQKSLRCLVDFVAQYVYRTLEYKN